MTLTLIIIGAMGWILYIRETQVTHILSNYLQRKFKNDLSPRYTALDDFFDTTNGETCEDETKQRHQQTDILPDDNCDPTPTHQGDRDSGHSTHTGQRD